MEVARDDGNDDRTLAPILSYQLSEETSVCASRVDHEHGSWAVRRFDGIFCCYRYFSSLQVVTTSASLVYSLSSVDYEMQLLHSLWSLTISSVE